MDVLGMLDYLAQRGELILTCNQVQYASDDLGIQLNYTAHDRRSYEQALAACVERNLLTQQKTQLPLAQRIRAVVF